MVALGVTIGEAEKRNEQGRKLTGSHIKFFLDPGPSAIYEDKQRMFAVCRDNQSTKQANVGGYRFSSSQ